MSPLRGHVWKFGDDINTDIIIPFRFKSRTNDPVEMAKYAMYGVDPDFHKKVHKGDFIVGGRNFGGGSSREQAPVALKYAGIGAVIAEGFARIFYRNAFAIGLPVLEVAGVTKQIEQGDELEVDLTEMKVRVLRTGAVLQAKKVSGFLEELLRTGGLVEYFHQFHRFPWQAQPA
jgi:3-isopropylmalate/(R)-2-methylmalate dehydratase small subunit